MRHSSIRPRDDGRAAMRVLATRVSAGHQWFADEVAIDFPSLQTAVERMRAGFDILLDGSGRSALSAELHLSAREAFDGATVPLDVPVRRVCGVCGGRGELWPDPCQGCDGTGEAMAHHPVRLIVPPRVQDGDRFALSLSAPSVPLTRVEVRVVLS